VGTGCTGKVSTGGNKPSSPGAAGSPAATVPPTASGSPTASGAPGASVPPAVAPATGVGSTAGIADGSAFFPGTTQGLTKTRIWQVTPVQYITTVSDALGVTIVMPRLLPTTRDHFLNDATALAVSDVSFANLEEDLRAQLLTQQAAITARLPCAVAALDATCAGTFLKSVGAVAQGLATPNIAPALQVFTTLSPKAGARPALDDALLALLMSPSVLFRTELGPQDATFGTPAPNATAPTATTPAATVSLTPVELSRAMSYSITNGPPDATLRGHAADGSLVKSDVFAAELSRLLASPRGQDGMKSFLIDWAGLASYDGLQKDLLVFPEFTPAVKQAMWQETTSFIDYILQQRGGSFVDLMTLQQSFVPPAEAGIYGLQATAPAGQLTTLPAGQRMGLFTQPAVLAMVSDPALSGVIYRGKFVLDRLVCLSLSPPPNVVVEFPDFAALGLGPDSTVKQRLGTVENIAQCGSCHKMLDPPGFAMEHYDSIGRYRADDQGKTIDATGALTFTRFTQEPFMDATQMFKTMATSPDVRACLTRQAFRYVFGRSETPADDPVLAKVYQQFASSGDVGGLVPQLVSSAAFALRERTAQ
jgi:Protein of unknown function (DUF1592)/Protein of unknown function (DUF1588)/Protein of unknown function (DUF1585)